MKRILLNVALACALTLIAYIALYLIWGALLSGVEDQGLRFALLVTMTTAFFGFFLLWAAKMRSSVGEDEIYSDYEEREYVSFVDDFKLIIKREARLLICIFAVSIACGAIDAVAKLAFQSPKTPIVVLLFSGMIMLGSTIKLPIVGYLLSATLDCTVYLVFLLLYRRRRYRLWRKSKI